jgi:hypothetical protein
MSSAQIVVLFLAGFGLGLVTMRYFIKVYRMGKRNAALGDIDWVVIPDRADPKLVALYRESFEADKKLGGVK